MAGGVGSRFWPMSRTSQPKQFIDILGTGETLIQQTFRRFERVCPSENIYIVTNELYRELIKKQIPHIKDEQIVCEPTRRNTAPCIAYANYKILQINPNANVIVAPSDHIILKEDAFIEVITAALKATEKNDWLLTLGIQPSRPDTGYGYIQFNDQITYAEDARINKVKTFTEKPVLEMAKSFIQSGDFLWNAGIFVWSLKSIMKAFEMYLPEVDSIFKEGMQYYNTKNEENFIKNAYTICKNISIDYGVMEKANNVFVHCTDFGWSDLGTWNSVYSISSKDDNQNVVNGNKAVLYHSTNNYIQVPKGKLTILKDLEGFIIIDSGDTLLICKRENEQLVKDMVADAKTKLGE